MPNTESAKRAMRKAERRRVRNKSQRSALKTLIKKTRTTVVAGDAAAKDVLGTAIKKLDQAASKHLIHKNKAARTKSRLMKLANKQAAAKTA